MFCERSEPALYAAPTCTTGEAPVYVYCLYGRYYQRTPRTIISNSVGCVCPCLRSVGTKKTSKNVLKNMYPRVGVIGGLVVYLASLGA